MKKFLLALLAALLVSCKTGGSLEPVVIDLSSAKTRTATPAPSPTPTPTAAPPATPTPAPAPPSPPPPAPTAAFTPARPEASRMPEAEGRSRTQSYEGLEIHEPTPEAVVKRLIEAYERRDLTALLALYASDARIYDPPDRLTASGLSQIARTYARRLAKRSGEVPAVSERLTQGRFLVERERGTGDADGSDSVVVIYEVRGRRIVKVWILR